jgi:hypothetical protein
VIELPRHAGKVTAEQAQDPLARIDAPRPFSEALAGLLEAGTTVLVTDAPVLEHTTGRRLDVLATGPAVSAPGASAGTAEPTAAAGADERPAASPFVD